MKYPFNAVAFTSEVASHYLPNGEYGRFAIDLDSIVIPNNPCIVDYNHDSGEVVGSAFIDVEEHKLVAVGELVSVYENDRASLIAATARDVPYGISPTLDLDFAEVVEVKEGEVYNANGREYVGPLYIYKNAVLLGISVCPYPTDGNTSLTMLKKGKLIAMSGLTKLNIDEQEPAPKDAENLNDEPPKTVKNEELQAYIDKFGIERGVEYYQNGVPMDEAVEMTLEDVLEENEELRRKLAKFENDCADPQKDQVEELENDVEKTPEEEEKTALSRVLTKLEQRLAKFEKALSQDQKARRRGDNLGLSDSRPVPRRMSYQDAFRDSIK